MILQHPHLVRTVGVVPTPDLHLGSGVHVAVEDVEDEAVPLTPDVFPLQPPLLVDLAVVLPAQHSGARLLAAPLQVHGQPCLVDQRLPHPLPEHSVTPTSLVHHGQLLSGDMETQAETVEMAYYVEISKPLLLLLFRKSPEDEILLPASPKVGLSQTIAPA